MFNPVEIAKQTDAPQQSNELVFNTPWEARVFAIVAHLSDQHKFAWNDFRDELITNIADASHEGSNCREADGTAYYRAWLATAEKLFGDAQFCTAEELDRKVHELSDPHAPGKHSPTGANAMPVAED